MTAPQPHLLGVIGTCWCGYVRAPKVLGGEQGMYGSKTRPGTAQTGKTG